MTQTSHAERAAEAQKLIQEAKELLVLAYSGKAYKSKINSALHRLKAADDILASEVSS